MSKLILFPPTHKHTPIFVLQNGRSLLWTALDERHLGLVKALIQAGADVNQTNKVEFSCPLSYRLSPLTNQHSSIIIALDKGHVDVVKKLIEAGANINHA